jgi:DNA-binding XRE family transcriptional regulator
LAGVPGNRAEACVWGDGLAALRSVELATSFENFVRIVEKEARADGVHAVAELEALRANFALATQLRRLREKRGLTQIELAERSGVPRSEIGKIERGWANPTVATLTALATPLDMTGIAFVSDEVLSRLDNCV